MCFEISFLNLRPQYVMEIPSVVWEVRFPCWFAVPWGAQVSGCSRTIGAAQWNETAILQERPLWYFWNSQGHTLRGLKIGVIFGTKKWLVDLTVYDVEHARPEVQMVQQSWQDLYSNEGKWGRNPWDFPIFSSFFFSWPGYGAQLCAFERWKTAPWHAHFWFSKASEESGSYARE